MWKLISFVKRGKVRRDVLTFLSAGPATPTDVAKKTKYHRPSVSRVLIELQKKGLVDCLTPDEKLGRIYAISKKGREILEKLDKLTNSK
jgi:predicted transcriptional regulator